MYASEDHVEHVTSLGTARRAAARRGIIQGFSLRFDRIDLSHAKPRKLTEELAKDAQLLITMGCGDKCPYVPGLRRDDWPLSDPKGRPIEEVRAIRDEVKSRVQSLLAHENLGQA